jgi:hypothetical protein
MVELRPLPPLFAIKNKNDYTFYRSKKDIVFNEPVNTVIQEDDIKITVCKNKQQYNNTNISLVKKKNIYSSFRWAYTDELLLSEKQEEFLVINLISSPYIKRLSP